MVGGVSSNLICHQSSNQNWNQRFHLKSTSKLVPSTRTLNRTLNRTLKERDRLYEKLKQNWQGNIRKDEERQDNQRWVSNGRQTKEHPRKARLCNTIEMKQNKTKGNKQDKKPKWPTLLLVLSFFQSSYFLVSFVPIFIG